MCCAPARRCESERRPHGGGGAQPDHPATRARAHLPRSIVCVLGAFSRRRVKRRRSSGAPNWSEPAPELLRKFQDVYGTIFIKVHTQCSSTMCLIVGKKPGFLSRNYMSEFVSRNDEPRHMCRACRLWLYRGNTGQPPPSFLYSLEALHSLPMPHKMPLSPASSNRVPCSPGRPESVCCESVV